MTTPLDSPRPPNPGRDEPDTEGRRDPSICVALGDHAPESCVNCPECGYCFEVLDGDESVSELVTRLRSELAALRESRDGDAELRASRSVNPSGLPDEHETDTIFAALVCAQAGPEWTPRFRALAPKYDLTEKRRAERPHYIMGDPTPDHPGTGARASQPENAHG